eukprot:2034262-Pleurochrysis_carterae.AAC.2
MGKGELREAGRDCMEHGRPIVLEHFASFEMLKNIRGHGAMKLFKGSAKRRGDAIALLVLPARAEHRIRPDKTETFSVVCNLAVFTMVRSHF